MQVYAMKFHNFLRFGEKDNTLVFDLTPQQKSELAEEKITMDDIYSKVVADPIGHIENVKKMGLEKQIGIIGLVDGDPDSSNGCGKSSIMEGICYAHYEKIVRKTANTDKIEKAGLSVVTKINGAYPKHLRESYVEEYLEDNNAVYRIKRGRTFSKSQNSSQPILEFECISKNEIDIRNSHRTGDTQEAISDVITMDYEVFVNSQMFGQSDAGKFLTGTDKTKKEMLISLLHLENVVVGCLELLRKKKNSQEKTVETLKSNLEFLENMMCKSFAQYNDGKEKEFETSMPDELIAVLNELRKKCLHRIDLCEKKNEETQKEIVALTKSDEMATVERIKNDGKRVKEEKSKKELEKNQRITEWEKLKDDEEKTVSNINAEIKKKTQRIDTSRVQREAIKKQIADFNEEECLKKIAEAKESQKLKPELNKSIAENKIKREELVKLLASKSSKRIDLVAEVKELNEQIKNISSDNFICSKCKSEVSRKHVESERDNIKTIIESIIAEEASLEKNKKEVENTIQQLDRDMSIIEKHVIAETKINGQIETNKAVKKQLESIIAGISDNESELSSLNEKLTNSIKKKEEYASKVIDISKVFDKDILEINEKIEKLREEYVKAKSSAKEIEDQLVKLKELQDKITSVRSENSEKIGSLDKEIGSCNALKDSIENKKKEYSEGAKLLNRYLLLENVYGLDGIQTRIVKKYLPLLNLYVKEFMDVLSGGTTSIKITVNDRSKIDLAISGGSADTYEMVSGGEKMMVRLAVDIGLALLSFSRSSQKPEMICLDEIFGCLDVSHRENVFNVLSKLSDKFSRVLIISHEKEICDKLKAKIIIDKSSGTFGLSKIRRIE